MPGLGHLGFGFVAKPVAPKVPLWVLLICSELLDFISIFFIITNIEDTWHSHGLFMAGIYSLIAMVVAGFISRNPRTSLLIGFVVFSHWVLDFIAWPMTYIFPDSSTRPPLLFDDSPHVGLGVSSTLFGLLIMEIGPNLVGGVIYLRYLKKRARKKH